MQKFNASRRGMTVLGLGMLAVMAAACGKSSSSTNTGISLPLLSPPVRTATPDGFASGSTTSVSDLLAGGGGVAIASLSSSDFKSRFFTSGPTNIFRILSDIDGRISGINTQSQTSSSTCLTQTPVKYTLTGVATGVTMYAQCYQTVGATDPNDPGLIQWGVQDGVFYLYTAIGAGRVAAIATPILGASGVTGGSGNYSVQAWANVGVLNGSSAGTGKWDNMSYGVMQLVANPIAKTLEMAVAGVGFGYCGAQYVSDGTHIYGKGSVDMAATCAATDTICVSGTDATTAASCTTAQQTFTLTPLGRTAVTGSQTGTPVTPATWAASTYPGGTANTITLGNPDTDSLAIGPTGPTTGVGKF